jgi:hypothetical protein
VGRKLFLLEFRRALTPFVLFVLASCGALYIAELWFAHQTKKSLELHGVINSLMFIIVIVIAFPAGARAFSKEFKDTHFLFLQSLPITRHRAWAVLVLANLAGSVLSVALFFVLRPSLLTQGIGDPGKAPDILSETFLAYFLLFCAGCCFSPLFGRPIFSYLAGFLVTAAVVGESFLIAGYSSSFSLGVWEDLEPFGRNIDIIFLAVAWMLVCVVYLLLSLRFYVLGEFNLLRAQVRNNLRLAASLGILFVFLIVSVHAGFFAALDGWEPAWYWYGDEGRPSNGKYIFVLEHRSIHPEFARIHILDLRTGAVLGHLERRGLIHSWWSNENGGLEGLVRDNSPLYRVGYLLPGSDQLLSLSPEARELHSTRFTFSRIHALQPLAGGRTLLVVSSGEFGKIESLDPSNGKLEELGGGYLDGSAGSLPVKNGNLIWFQNAEAPTRVWWVGSDTRELKWAPSPEPERNPACVIEGIVYKSESACVRAVAKLYPFLGEKASFNQQGGVRGWYVRPRWGMFYLDTTMKIYYIQQDPTSHQGRLFVLLGPQQSWRLVGEGIPLSPYGAQSISPGQVFFPNNSNSLSVDSIKGLVAFYIEKGNKVTGFLYDDGLGKTIQLGELEMPPEPQGIRITMTQFPGMESVVILFQKYSPQAYEGFTFKYAPQSGMITRLPTNRWPAQASLLHMDEDGNLAYSLWDPYRIISVSADQKQRQLWPPPGK